MTSSIAALLCVCGIAIGQILFKCTAESLRNSESYINPTTIIWLFLALIVYGVTTIGWIYTLQYSTLSRIYPLMALAFILVPLMSVIVFGESLNFSYWIGVAMIVTGVVISVRS